LLIATVQSSLYSIQVIETQLVVYSDDCLISPYRSQYRI
jgi:hypothetical protein